MLSVCPKVMEWGLAIISFWLLFPPSSCQLPLFTCWGETSTSSLRTCNTVPQPQPKVHFSQKPRVDWSKHMLALSLVISCGDHACQAAGCLVSKEVNFFFPVHTHWVTNFPRKMVQRSREGRFVLISHCSLSPPLSSLCWQGSPRDRKDKIG